MTATHKIFKNAWICQREKRRIKPVFGDIYLSGEIVRRVIPKDFNAFSQSQVDKSEQSMKNQWNMAGRVLTLPLINFHDHFYSRLAKGLPVTGPQHHFLQILENLWWKLDQELDEDMIRAAVHLSALESVRNGVTTIFDHHASPHATRGILKIISDTVRLHGLRAVLCLETSDRHGIDRAKESLLENRQFIENDTDNQILGMLGLHAPFTLSDDTLITTAGMVKYLSTAIHIHLAEDKHEMEYSLKNFGLTATERLDKFSLLTPKTILGHGIYLNQHDYQLIAQHHSAIAYNPDSNMNNAVGLPEYGRVPKEIPILPGTDGMHANVARSLKQLFLLQRHQGIAFTDAFQWMERMYFDSYQFVSQLFPDFSSLQEGDRADFVLWDYVPPTPFREDNFWAHWIYGILEAPPHTVVQRGEVLLEENKFVKVDPSDLYPEIYRQGERLYTRFRKLGH